MVPEALWYFSKNLVKDRTAWAKESERQLIVVLTCQACQRRYSAGPTTSRLSVWMSASSLIIVEISEKEGDILGDVLSIRRMYRMLGMK